MKLKIYFRFSYYFFKVKTDNHIGGRYFARLLKEVCTDLEEFKYQNLVLSLTTTMLGLGFNSNPQKIAIALTESMILLYTN